MEYNKFIGKAKAKHGDKYIYPVFENHKSIDKIKIICPEHGEFEQNLYAHLKGQSCPHCAKNKNYTTEEFIEHAREVHGDKYDYSKSVYVNYITKVEIICPKHGSFWQQPSCHINGYNCPHCQQSKMEMEMEKMLRENNINFIIQKRFTWLNRLSLDFYLPEHNIAIECQGQQHFISIEFFDTKDDDFDKRINRDIEKFNKLKENNINLLYLLPNDKIDYSNINKIQEIYTKDNTFINCQDLLNNLQ